MAISIADCFALIHLDPILANKQSKKTHFLYNKIHIFLVLRLKSFSYHLVVRPPLLLMSFSVFGKYTIFSLYKILLLLYL